MARTRQQDNTQRQDASQREDQHSEHSHHDPPAGRLSPERTGSFQVNLIGSSDADNPQRSIVSDTSDQHPNHHSMHWLENIADTSKHTSGLNLVPKFTGNNWPEFRDKLEMQFTVMSLHTFLKHPPRLQSLVDRRNDEIAKAQISLRLHPAQLKRVKSCSHTYMVWETLKKIFDPTPEDSASNLFLDFIHYRMKTGQSVKDYLDHLTEVYHELALQEVMIGELAFVAKALDGLTQEFGHTKAAAKASGIHSITEIYNLLIAAQKDRGDRKVMEVTSLNTETRDNRPQRYCSRCRTETHNTNKCWILHPELRPNNHFNRGNNNGRYNNRNDQHQRQRSVNQRNNHTSQQQHYRHTQQQEQNDDEPETFTGYNTTSNASSINDLLIDSGGNKSMTNNRSILTNYRADSENTTVQCSNGQHLPVHGRGDIILKYHNIKLSDVLYAVIFIFGVWGRNAERRRK
jgi:hypothetical protein